MQLVQACHAVAEATRYYPPPDTIIPNLVVFGVANEVQLLNVKTKLHNAGVKHSMFIEPDIGGQATALATETVFNETRRLFRNYQLLKGVA